MKKILLTSVCRPLGEKYGDGPSVGYELLYGQVTRAQGMFSPRATHIHFSLEYVAENLDAPVTVLQYPSRRELVRELKKGYDVVGLSFLLATFHRMKEAVALIREHAPQAKIVLGGYGTVLPDEVLAPYADAVCREEGVAFMRRYLGEPELPMPYRHPLVVSRLRVFGREVSRTGMVFAGLGCPNGCDFCCTSYFFKRKHVPLLPSGRDIYRVIERYQELEPGMPCVILDEDFLLDKKRAMEFHACVRKGGRPLSIFVFASIRAISRLRLEDILEMGIDGFWIGYEGTRSGYAKQSGRPAEELFAECRENGIAILASMIVGLPYQTPEMIEAELEGLLALKPAFTQFLIYGPSPGTPFYDRIMEEGLMHRELADDRERYYRHCTGFTAMVKHPAMEAREIEAWQARCFERDFEKLGPSIYRSVETQFLGYLKHRDSERPLLRRKAEYFAEQVRKAYPAFLAGRIFGPNAAVRADIAAQSRRIYAELGAPTWKQRLQSLGALGLAAGTEIIRRLGLFQHPRLIRHTFRMPHETSPSRHWRRLRRHGGSNLGLSVEQRPEATVWLRLEGAVDMRRMESLTADIAEALRRTESRLVLDLARLTEAEHEAMEKIARGLKQYCGRIRVILPAAGECAALAAAFALYR